MADVISGNGTIILDDDGVEDAVFYSLTITDEPGKLLLRGLSLHPRTCCGRAKRPSERRWHLKMGRPLR